VADHRIAGALVAGAERELVLAGRAHRDAIAADQLLELVRVVAAASR